MPQLSLYIDEKTLAKIELAAKLENLSLSRWVVHKLKDSLENAWPHGYESLYGSIRDESFEINRSMDFEIDIPREKL